MHPADEINQKEMKIAQLPDPRWNILGGVRCDCLGTTRLFRITAAGAVTEVPLSRAARHCSNLMIDQQGQYVFMDFSVGELLRVTPGGQVTTIQTVVPRVMNVVGFTQDPGSGDYVIAVAFRQRLIRMGASGPSFLTAQDSTYLNSPEAVIVERDK